MTAHNYLIWSHEHGAWWGPHSRGYTVSLADAGRYPRVEALQICRQARGGWMQGTAPPEIPVRLQDALLAGLGPATNHPVDALKEADVHLTDDQEAEIREFCDQPVNRERP